MGAPGRPLRQAPGGLHAALSGLKIKIIIIIFIFRFSLARQILGTKRQVVNSHRSESEFRFRRGRPLEMNVFDVFGDRHRWNRPPRARLSLSSVLVGRC